MWSTSFGLCQLLEHLGDMEQGSSNTDDNSQLLVWWYDAPDDNSSFNPACIQCHPWVPACEKAAGQGKWTGTVARGTVRAYDITLDVNNCLSELPRHALNLNVPRKRRIKGPVFG